jgi:hypothetical protein
MAENNIDPHIQQQINEHWETMAKILPGLTKSTKDMTEAEIAQAAAAKSTAQSLANYNAALNSGSNALKGFAFAMTTTTTEFSKFSGVLKESGDAAMALGKNFGALGTVVGILFKSATMLAQAQLKQADNVLKASDDLSKMGVAGGMTTGALLDMAHKAGYSSESLASYTKATKSLGTDIMGLGGNVKQGVKAFGELTNVGNSVYESFQRLGVSQEELTQNQADYVKLQVSSGKVITERMKQDGSLRAASLEYTKNLLELSAISGASLEEAKKVKEAAHASFDITIKTQELEEEKQRLLATGNAADKEKAAQIEKEMKANDAMLEAAKLTGDAQFLAATQSRIATGAWTEQSMVLRNVVPEFEKLQRGLKDGTITQGDYMKAIAEGTQKQRQQFGTAAKFDEELAKSRGLSLSMLQFSAKTAGKDMAGALAEAKGDINAAASGTGKGAGTDNAQIARNELTTATRNTAVELDKLLAATNPLLSGWNALTIATTALTAAAVAAAVALGAIAIGKNVKGLLGTGGGGALAQGAESLIGSSGASKGAGRARDAAGRFTKMPKGVASNVEKLGGLGGMAEKAGGGGVGGFMTGIANGLKAFANPQVMLGAAGFGVAIAAIGAGIAGATWLVGKALPTLSEGMKSFENLDGKKLEQSGKGILELGKGLAVFGAGGAAAGIGSILGNLSDGIVNFFGGKTPIDKLVEFSKLNIDGKKTKENAEAFIAFGEAMTKSSMGSAAIGNLVGNVADSIGNFFSGKTPIDKFVQFSKLDIDSKKTKDNAEAFVSFSKAMSEYKGGPTNGIVGEIAESISTFFKINPPFNKFVEFSKLDIADPDKVKKNATAFAAFGSAMATSGLGSASSGLGNLVGGVADAVGKLFGKKDAIEKFVEFSKLQIDPKRTKELAEAFKAYAEGISASSSGKITSAPSVYNGTARPATASGAGGAASTSGAVSTGGGAAMVAPRTGNTGTSASSGSTSGVGSPTVAGRPTMVNDPRMPPGSSEAGASGAALSELLKFTSNTGSETSFKDLDSSFQQRVIAAAEEYKSITGKLLQINSAKRDPADQERIYEETVKAGRPGIGPNGMPVGKPGKSRHERGQAVDIQQGKGDDKAIQALAKQGLIQGVPGDPVHFQLPQLKDGAVTSGTSVAMIGEGKNPEVLAPFDPNSLLAKMLLAPAADTIAQTSVASNNDNSTMDNSILLDLMQMISDKLDEVIDVLEDGNNTSSEILQYSQA